MISPTFKDHLKILGWKCLVIFSPSVWFKRGVKSNNFDSIGKRDAEALIYKHILSKPPSGHFEYDNRDSRYLFDHLSLWVERGRRVVSFAVYVKKLGHQQRYYDEPTIDKRFYTRPSRWFNLASSRAIRRYEKKKLKDVKESFYKEFSDIIIDQSNL